MRDLFAQAAELNGIHRAVPDRHSAGQFGEYCREFV
jgi:hypothetical protein